MTEAARKKAYKALQVKYAKQVGRLVKKGVKFLDAELPEWVEKADVSTLDLGNAECCMLGQAHHAHYDGGIELLSEVEGEQAQPSDYGFNLPDWIDFKLDDLNEDLSWSQNNLSESPFWSILQEEWNNVLVKRICALTSQRAKARLEELRDNG